VSPHALFWTFAWQSLAGVQQTQAKSDGVYSATTNYELLLNHFMSSIWIQSVMF
jgi:hypothetical protein